MQTTFVPRDSQELSHDVATKMHPRLQASAPVKLPSFERSRSFGDAIEGVLPSLFGMCGVTMLLGAWARCVWRRHQAPTCVPLLEFAPYAENKVCPPTQFAYPCSPIPFSL